MTRRGTAARLRSRRGKGDREMDISSSCWSAPITPLDDLFFWISDPVPSLTIDYRILNHLRPYSLPHTPYSLHFTPLTTISGGSLVTDRQG